MVKKTSKTQYPVTRFRGSKRKVIDWIEREIMDIKFNSVYDGFSGSSIVSYMFKKNSKSVYANDILKFNSIIGEALIENSKWTVSDFEVDNFVKKVKKGSDYSFVSETFEGMYFLDEENKFLDNFIFHIHNTKFTRGDKYKKAILLYALFQSCLIKRPYNLFHRANLSMRTRDVKRTFGNKVSWDRPFEGYIYRFVKECNQLVIDNKQKCRVTNNHILRGKKKFDLVYLDPPYLKSTCKETSDYLKFYHFLEGLARYDEWGELIDKNSSIKSIDVKHYQYNSHEGIKLFKKMINRFLGACIVISYGSEGYPSVGEIVDLLVPHYKSVEVKTMQYNYVLSKSSSKGEECLIIAK